MIQGRYGNANAYEIAEMLGFRNGKYPDEGHDGTILQGHDVWVVPKQKGAGMKMRAMTRCRACGKILPVGRLAQHERAVHEGIPHGRYPRRAVVMNHTTDHDDITTAAPLAADRSMHR